MGVRMPRYSLFPTSSSHVSVKKYWASILDQMKAIPRMAKPAPIVATSGSTPSTDDDQRVEQTDSDPDRQSH